MRERTAEGMLVLAAAIWGLAFVYQRSAMAHIGPYFFSGLRFGIAAIFLFVVTAMVVGRVAFQRDELQRGAVLGFLLFLGNALQQIGLVYTTAGKAGFITGLYIVFVPLMLSLFWRVKISRGLIFGVLISTLGLFLLSVSGRDLASLHIAYGDSLVLGCALVFALHVALAGTFTRRTEPLVLALVQVSVASGVSFLMAFITETTDLEQINFVWRELFYTGIVSAGIGYTLQLFGQRRCDETVAGMIMSLESAFALIGGTLLLNEIMTPRQLFGCGLMLAGIVISQRKQVNKVVGSGT